jgi:DNA mismatch endonuclease, patch repair protein
MSGQSIRARAPAASSPQVRRVMQANWGGNTKPEQVIRSTLHSLGLRFRKHLRPIPTVRCEADVVFPSSRVCIFVDGCFWHGCPLHYQNPKANTAWWDEKIKANIERDHRNSEVLARAGWRVIRLWEHDLDPAHLAATAKMILVQVKRQN